MRRKRGRKVEKVDTPKTDQQIKKYDKPVIGVVYLNEKDVLTVVQVPFYGETYSKHVTYKDNFESACYEILQDSGGFWIDDKNVVPSSRIRRMFMVEESAPENLKKENQNKSTKENNQKPQEKQSTNKK